MTLDYLKNGICTKYHKINIVYNGSTFNLQYHERLTPEIQSCISDCGLKQNYWSATQQKIIIMGSLWQLTPILRGERIIFITFRRIFLLCKITIPTVVNLNKRQYTWRVCLISIEALRTQTFSLFWRMCTLLRYKVDKRFTTFSLFHTLFWRLPYFSRDFTFPPLYNMYFAIIKRF